MDEIVLLVLAVIALPIIVAIVVISRLGRILEEVGAIRIELRKLQQMQILTSESTATEAPESSVAVVSLAKQAAVSKEEIIPSYAPETFFEIEEEQPNEEPVLLRNAEEEEEENGADLLAEMIANPVLLEKAPSQEKDEETQKQPSPPGFFAMITNFIRAGHGWAAGGVIMLILGFGYLFTYIADAVTIETRLASVALVGLMMIAAGVWLGKMRRIFSMILQGGGGAVLYMTIFGATKLTDSMPVLVALVLMSALVVAITALAVIQNAQILALFGFIGGYVAPLLLSDGSGNFVGLFSYYLLLGVGLLALSRFKYWPWLNLASAVMSFAVFALWQIQVDHLAVNLPKALPFLIGFMVLFTAITLSVAQKRHFSFGHIPDLVLALATPFVFLILLSLLVSSAPNAILPSPDLTVSSAKALKDWGAHSLSLALGGASLFYLLLSFLTWHFLPHMRKLAAFYLVFGVVAVNLVLPIETSANMTAALWAIEGAAFFFFACLERSSALKIFALLAQICGIAFLLQDAFYEEQSILLPAALVGLALLLSGLIQRASEGHYIGTPPPVDRIESGLRLIHLANLMILSGAFIWLFGAMQNAALQERHALAVFLLSVSIIGLLLFALYRILDVALLRESGFLPLAAAAFALLQPLLMAFFDGFRPFDNLLSENFLAGIGFWAWVAFILCQTLILWGERDQFPKKQAFMIASFALILVIMTTSSGRALTQNLNFAQSWVRLSGIFPSLIFIGLLFWLAPRFRSPPHIKAILGVAPFAIMLVLGWWLLASFTDIGNPAPLPVYIPLLNPLELLQALCLVAFVMWQILLRPFALPRFRLSAKIVLLISDGLIFLWLHGILFRSAYHFLGFPIEGAAPYLDIFFLLHFSSTLQTCITLLWAIGAVLLCAVAMKLFLIDIADKGTLLRIVSFLGAGILFLVVGWMAPLPPSFANNEDKKEGAM